MIEISLTQFVQFVLSTGPDRLTAVREARRTHEQGYDPKTDPYKELRDAIVVIHRAGQSIAALDELVSETQNEDRQNTYLLLVSGYKRFLEGRTIEWQEPPHGLWEATDLTVRTSPELGLRLDGVAHVIKLHLTVDKLSLAKARMVLHLLQLAVGEQVSETALGVLDVRTSKLTRAENFDPDMNPLLESEAQSFVSIYERL